MKVINQNDNTVQVQQLQDGQIAIIKQWNGRDDYIGRVVQRYGDSLVSLGEDSGKGWLDITIQTHKDLRVEILPKGTQLEI